MHICIYAYMYMYVYIYIYDYTNYKTSETSKNVVLLRQNGNEGPRGTAQLAYSSGAGAAVLESKKSRGTTRDRFL